MNCCITLVIALTLTSIISASQCFFFWGWSLMGKDIPGWLCVAHVFGHVHAQIPEKHRAKPCFALQNKNTACQFGYKGGKVEAGVVRGFASCQRCQSPSRQIVRVSWGVEREALLWFWSTDQCQAWSIGVVLWREDGGDGVGGGGVKRLGNLEYKWRWLPPPVVPWQTSLPETSEKQRRRCWRGERCLISGTRPVVWEPWSAWFQGHGLTSQEGPSCVPAGYDPPPPTHTQLPHTPPLHLNQAAGTHMTLCLGLDCCNVYTTGDNVPKVLHFAIKTYLFFLSLTALLLGYWCT